ncbi:hypothetical protein K3G63_04760 [Hymenobacter sp. HSC-4F20]|uniref:relaxase/mobilization nuclease domain-containing protein n=1 Tax=Hymenobacter sp. HSC-4F20 TaxID=2864135 RepID=UPI001C73C51C|nr:hypothetical protein [Hymenobacter sp. HSC-4F20]MBX0289735.1 hypothetical protein [Hymenobacter sp. HSC-4F20]
MLIKANTRKDLKGRHSYLLKNRQNDRAEVMDIRGTVFDDDHELAFKQLGAITTKHKKPFLSVSINPAKGYDQAMTTEQWMRSVEIVEQRLNLTGQPRIVVLHEKKGEDGEPRTHIHVDWRRVKNGSLISDSNMRYKLVQAKKEMELEFGHARTKDYDRQDYAIAERVKKEREAQGRMAQKEKAAEFAQNRPDVVNREMDAVERMLKVKRQQEKERNRGLER